MSWVQKADEDIASARLLASVEPPLLGSAAYHCQQAAEKLLKAVLVVEHQPVPKIHDLAELAKRLLGVRADLREVVTPLTELTEWGAVYRYPVLDTSLAEPEPDRAAIGKALRQIVVLKDVVTASLSS